MNTCVGASSRLTLALVAAAALTTSTVGAARAGLLPEAWKPITKQSTAYRYMKAVRFINKLKISQDQRQALQHTIDALFKSGNGFKPRNQVPLVTLEPRRPGGAEPGVVRLYGASYGLGRNTLVFTGGTLTAATLQPLHAGMKQEGADSRVQVVQMAITRGKARKGSPSVIKSTLFLTKDLRGGTLTDLLE